MRLPLPARSATAVSLAVMLCLGVSAGPVLADDQPPTTTPTVSAPAETTTPDVPVPSTATPPAPTSSEPTTTEPVPSPAPQAQEAVDLRLRVWFEKSVYPVHEPITAHASVTNVGTASAHQVMVSSTGNVWPLEWRPLDPGSGGVTIDPGQTAEASATGTVQEDFSTVHLAVTVWTTEGEPDANPDDNSVSATVPLEIRYGSYRGTVYGDRDADHVIDPGEGLPGVDVTLSGGVPGTVRYARADESGRFELTDLPFGSYYLTFSSYPGWVLLADSFVLNEPDHPAGVFRAMPQVSGNLTATLAFAEKSYPLGSTARAVLTLENTGPVPLTDLTAACEMDFGYGTVEADVGELRDPGVTLPVGVTRQYDVTLPVSDVAVSWGYVRLTCLVGAPPRVNDLRLEALVSVPGGVAPMVTGLLLKSRLAALGLPPGTPVPNVKVYLRNRLTGTIAARDITTAAGRFTFYDVPAGLYDFGLVGPWQLEGPLDFQVSAGENGSYTRWVVIKPGPEQPDPDAVPPSGGEVVPTPEGDLPVLAETGAAVAWLAFGGLFSVAVGCALVLCSPRRLRR
ncbi:hypothetical protein SAMN05216553_13316 [Lentzea fradiae]|uniref:Uncharacterized protein n=1 Tax=Lentzea fradiae TaxID=200378 RepID=A0A1G8DPX5_9PSEU|nr:carboxypeptidase-like regulatory domain-containing protein [Lentzea fradiae]SDH59746.1 hypothetical protein SAMN05216553_13316 [Lentzea fradiae]